MKENLNMLSIEVLLSIICPNLNNNFYKQIRKNDINQLVAIQTEIVDIIIKLTTKKWLKF